MKKILTIITKGFMALTIAATGVLATGVATGSVAYATECKKGNATTALKPADLNKCTKELNDRIYGLARVVAGIVLGFAVLMIVYAGFKYTTSQGDPKVTEQAKMQIVSAAIGIGIAMLAFVIVGIFEKVMS